MSNRKSARRFQFQRFAVSDERCGMKIGTDAILLGAWSKVAGVTSILDVGTGCGLIALMLAQRTERNQSQIVAIDCEIEAVQQATENIVQSPWSDRITVVHQKLQQISASSNSLQFDLCVCNPPYFNDSFPSSGAKERTARHEVQMSREDLFVCTKRLLNPTGRLCIVVPVEQLGWTEELAVEHGFYLVRQTHVRPFAEYQPKRALLEFKLQPESMFVDGLTIWQAQNKFTDRYQQLTKEFHPRFAGHSSSIKSPD